MITPDDIEVVHMRGGYYSYAELKDGIYVMNVRSTTKGAGNQLLRALIRFARDKGKPLYGLVNRQQIHGMNNDRLARWYKHFGGELITIAGKPGVTLRI